jgi:hypothetical protein
MPREVVRSLLPGPVDSFRKGPVARYETDGFHNFAFQVFYGGDTPTVEYIELFANDEFRAIYRGMDVFGTPADKLVNHIRRDAPCDEFDCKLRSSYVFPRLDLSLWRARPMICKSAEDEEGRFFSTIGVGVVGYYRG